MVEQRVLAVSTEAPLTERNPLLLRLEVEEFFYREADLLDQRKFDDWVQLFTDDARYWMPLRRNVPSEELELENTAEGREVSWFDEGKAALVNRVKQMKTGVHWAEEPYSRMSHLVSNVLLLEVGETEVRTRCRILVHRNRMVDEESLFVGQRVDTLRRVDGTWRIARREIIIDQSVLLAKNLTTFF